MFLLKNFWGKKRYHGGLHPCNLDLAILYQNIDFAWRAFSTEITASSKLFPVSTIYAKS